MLHTINELQISYREVSEPVNHPNLSNSKEVAELLFKTWDKGTIGMQECFKVVLLSNANRVKCIHPLSLGGITGTLVDVRLLFAIVLKTLSVNIILAHNHPSGTLGPSVADRALTAKIQKVAKFHDIRVLDHIILAPSGGYFSFSDRGIL